MFLPRNEFAAHERIRKALRAAFYEMLFPELVEEIKRRRWLVADRFRFELTPVPKLHEAAATGIPVSPVRPLV